MANFTTQSKAGCCKYCGNPVRGRADKQYCNDMCRNAYNNAKLNQEHTEIRMVEMALKRNRRILKKLLGEKKIQTLPRAMLSQKGFAFRYHTHNHTSAKGQQYTFCYDYGYMEAEHDRLVIVRAFEGYFTT
ncbi:hypothetical protein [Arachidicoccus terrestris]|uniref:hypothetical protein n=1 Tax=Arachidicoccus terrestris TaxID=2875539 RepID=UPI001CC678B5|nr:hypothetical protein [Arachidicoccus terrestris]UAY55683.1 hypothetical protein K9M52_01225 [Arachidicoccus terrestris]